MCGRQCPKAEKTSRQQAEWARQNSISHGVLSGSPMWPVFGNHRRSAPGPCSRRILWSSVFNSEHRQLRNNPLCTWRCLPMGKVVSSSPLTPMSRAPSWSRIPATIFKCQLESSHLAVIRTLMEERILLDIGLEVLRIVVAKGSSQRRLQAGGIGKRFCHFKPPNESQRQ